MVDIILHVKPISLFNRNVNMSSQRSCWFRVPLTKQLKRDNAGHWEVTIKDTDTVADMAF